MSLFCSSSPSTSRPILSKLAPRQVLSFLYPRELSRGVHPQAREHCRRASGQVASASIGVEAWFIQSLANVGNSHRHTRKPLQPTTFFTATRPKIPLRNRELHVVTFQRHQHTEDGVEEAPGEGDVDDVENAAEELPPESNRTREELLELVDQYHGIQNTDQRPMFELPPRSPPSDEPDTTVPDEPEDESPPDYTWPADAETSILLEELRTYIKESPDKDPQEIYESYMSLPAPRAPYLPSSLRHAMLHHLAVVEKKDEHSMLRYLSVVDDMKRAAIPLTVSEWTSAISFVASYVHKITEVEVEAALQMWREMEQVSGIKGNEATFNVLFDAACKAGKFVLAEMVYKEMESRGLPADRFHHVSLIFYYGLKQNADAARAAYRALVEAGEIVDTVVLNAMISALIRASEPAAAENVYERMKRMHFGREHPELPLRDWKKRRVVNLSLKRLGSVSKTDLKLREKYQGVSIVAPDLHTYRILINYSAVKAGDLEMTARLLSEMKMFGLGLHGLLFLAVFKGFATHGGVRYSEWDESRLESVWNSLLKSINDGVEDVQLSKWLVTWALYAFGKCSGKARMMHAWEEIREVWADITEQELEFVLGNLRSVLDGPDFVAKKRDWLLGM
ncbi:pentatricopeptide repeat-containing protein-like protein [Rhexocercosporidium sp. MPI-PUGE-AT-0058]|nr:pentatricopeptide repeat-containing protein-like protein [Rhexocercosporidium sp. MPI-PUGE-AT-0058]